MISKYHKHDSNVTTETSKRLHILREASIPSIAACGSRSNIATSGLFLPISENRFSFVYTWESILNRSLTSLHLIPTARLSRILSRPPREKPCVPFLFEEKATGRKILPVFFTVNEHLIKLLSKVLVNI